MTKLRDLDGAFVRREVRVEPHTRLKSGASQARPSGPYVDGDFEVVTGPREYHVVCDISVADGLMFLCPKCFSANGGPVGTHSVICWFVGRVPDDIDPKPGRWTPSGTCLDDVTFVPSEGRSCSVLLTGGCGWHGFVASGDAT